MTHSWTGACGKDFIAPQNAGEIYPHLQREYGDEAMPSRASSNKQPKRKPIKVIPTRYSGYLFRSRLEARWAYFFDCMGASWEYEPGTIEVGGDLADLDFWLPVSRRYVEIKPATYTPGSKPLPRQERVMLSLGNASLVAGDPLHCILNKTIYEFGADGITMQSLWSMLGFADWDNYVCDMATQAREKRFYGN